MNGESGERSSGRDCGRPRRADVGREKHPGHHHEQGEYHAEHEARGLPVPDPFERRQRNAGDEDGEGHSALLDAGHHTSLTRLER